MGRGGGEASAKERRCQVKFALTEGERLASSCVRRRVRSTKCARGEGGLLKIFAAVNITRGERKKDFFLPVLSANYIYAHTQLTPSSRLCILMISPPPSCMEISLSHPSLDPLPPRFAQELRRYQPSSRHQAHPCLYIDSTSTTHQTNLSEQQSKSQNWRIRLFFSRSLWAGKKSSSLISLFFIRLLPMQLTSCFTFDSPPPSEQLELPTTCGPGIALDQDRDFCSWGLTTKQSCSFRWASGLAMEKRNIQRRYNKTWTDSRSAKADRDLQGVWPHEEEMSQDLAFSKENR